jgi:hypothetical protein
MKMDDASIPEAKKKLQFLYWLDFMVKALFLFGVGYALFKVYNGSFTTQSTLVNTF